MDSRAAEEASLIRITVFEEACFLLGNGLFYCSKIKNI
jgi:hypothetical protein